MRLYHVSEEPGIARFEPRVHASYPDQIVWAVDDAKLRNYLLPRDCPRVTFFANEKTSESDRERFLGESKVVVAFEARWLEVVRRTRLFVYELPHETFKCVDVCAGYFHSTVAVDSVGVEVFDDLLSALVERDAEIRVMPSLWALNDAVLKSTLQFSIIRMRNAAPRM